MDLTAQKGWMSQREHCYWVPASDIVGAIPSDLSGTFIRNGPGINSVYGKMLKHPIDGDGMVCKVTFQDGLVHFHSKFVQSEHRSLESQMKKFIQMGQMGTRNKSFIRDFMKAAKMILLGGSPELVFRNPSNTNVMYWGGKVLSFYETFLPHCLDPYTLETLGLDDLGGSLTLGNAGAHFRIDPESMRLVCFSLRAGLGREPTLQIMEYNKDWTLHLKRTLHITGLNYAHDFLLLKDYYLFHITPFSKVSKWLAFLIVAGWTSPGESMRYYKELSSKFVLIPRARGENDEILSFETSEPYHIFHYGTGCQSADDTEIVFTSVCLDRNFNMDFDKNITLSNASVSPGRLYRHKINLVARTCFSEQIDPSCVEFPTVHPYRHGLPNSNIVYMMGSDRSENIPFRDVIKLDASDMRRQVWYSDGVIGEPVFAPRLGCKSSHVGDEDDGYVLVQLYKPQTHSTDFCVLDARKIDQGPVARIQLKHHVPYGFHGTFTPEVLLPTSVPTLPPAKL